MTDPGLACGTRFQRLVLGRPAGGAGDLAQKIPTDWAGCIAVAIILCPDPARAAFPISLQTGRLSAPRPGSPPWGGPPLPRAPCMTQVSVGRHPDPGRPEALARPLHQPVLCPDVSGSWGPGLSWGAGVPLPEMPPAACCSWRKRISSRLFPPPPFPALSCRLGQSRPGPSREAAPSPSMPGRLPAGRHGVDEPSL